MVEEIVIDFLNWQTMIIELCIAGIVAGWFFWRQKLQGDKIEKIMSEQEEFRKRRESWSSHSLHSFLITLRNQMAKINDITNERKKHVETSKNYVTLTDLINSLQEQNSFFINKIVEVINQSQDVLDPVILNEAREITNDAKGDDYTFDESGDILLHYVNSQVVIKAIDELLKKIKLPSL